MEISELKPKIKRYANDMVRFAATNSSEGLNSIILSCRDLKRGLNGVKKHDAEFNRFWDLICDIEIHAENACEDQQVAGRLVHFKDRMIKLNELCVIFASIA